MMSPSSVTSSATFFKAAASVAALAGMLTAADAAVKVLTPSEGMTVVAERPYMVSWGGPNATSDDRFDIDLHYCGSYSFCFEEVGDCGFWIANVCSSDDDPACMQNQADMSAQVTLPEPINGHSNNGYRMRISEVGAEDNFYCSEDFYLVASADADAPGQPNGPTLTVLEPSADSMALAGETYTVEFDYDNGFGERLGRFKIGLYEEVGAGDCGKWVTSICDKPGMGCHDSQGDYNIQIPSETTDGMYKIRVGVFGDDSVYGCSDAFEVVSRDDNVAYTHEMSMGFSYSYSYSYAHSYEWI